MTRRLKQGTAPCRPADPHLSTASVTSRESLSYFSEACIQNDDKYWSPQIAVHMVIKLHVRAPP